MPDINRSDIISDEALQAPAILQKGFENALATLKAIISTAKEYDKAIQTSSQTVSDHKKHTQDLSDQERVLAQIKKQVAVETAKQTDKFREQAAILSDLKTKSKELSADQNLTKNFQMQYASATELTKALNANRVAHAALRGEAERNSAAGKKLQQTIVEQARELDKYNVSIGKTSGSMEQLFAKLGPIGQKGSEVFKTLGESATSGWGVATAAISAGGFALKQFFDRTENGQLIWENALKQMGVRWDIFKNKIGTATGNLLGATDLSAESSYEARRKDFANKLSGLQNTKLTSSLGGYGQYAGAGGANFVTESERKKAIDDLTKEYMLTEQIINLTVQKKKIMEEENEVLLNNADKLNKAVELEVDSRKQESLSVKERLKDITEADKLYREVQKEELSIAQKKADLASNEIILRSTGRRLTTEETNAILLQQKAVKDLQFSFESTAKRRTSYMESLMGQVKSNDGSAERLFKYNVQQGKEQVQIDTKKRLGGLGGDAAGEFNQNMGAKGKLFNDQLHDTLKEANKNYLEDKRKKEEDELAYEKLISDKRIELAKTASAAIVSTVNSQFDAQIGRMQVHLNQLKENYQEEMELSSGNKIAQAQLTAKFREDEKRAQKEMLTLKRKEAEFDKVAAEASVVFNTAKAIMKDVAMFYETAGEPFAAIDAAVGAIQLAAIQARPLPSYEFGTTGHSGGKAVVGEAGFELYKTPGGKVGFTPDHASIMELPKGTQVNTHDETLQLLALAGLSSSSFDRQQKPNEKVIAELREVKKAIKEQKREQVDFYKSMSGYYSFKKESETFARKVMLERFGNI